jgi:hypothetical protein
VRKTFDVDADIQPLPCGDVSQPCGKHLVDLLPKHHETVNFEHAVVGKHTALP